MEETLTVPATGDAGWSATEFDDLVREHQARIYRVLWCELRDDEAAANLTQECFLKAYRGRAEFRGESSVATWLVRIALNLALDCQRSQRQKFWRCLLRDDLHEAGPGVSAAMDTSPGADRALLAREQLQRTMEAVRTLSPQQQTAFHLRFMEEMSIEQISAAMGIERGTVKSHLSRAVSALRQRRDEP